MFSSDLASSLFKMKKNLLIAFIFLTLASAAQKLVPGYMGQRTSLGYAFSVCPYSNSLDYHPILTETINIGYVFSQQREITFGVDYITWKINNPGYSLADPENRFNAFGYALGMKRFRRAKFAPLGAYHQCQLTVYTGSVAFSPYQLKSYDGKSLVNYSGGKLQAEGWGFAYSIGIQRMVHDRIGLDLGLKGSLMVFVDEDSGRGSYEKHLVAEGPDGMSGLPLLNGYIGLRFLAH
jgi:hypothetical protein